VLSSATPVGFQKWRRISLKYNSKGKAKALKFENDGAIPDLNFQLMVRKFENDEAIPDLNFQLMVRGWSD
jgi:hypothetical protein